MASWVFALFIIGGLWLFLWRSRARWLGLAPIAVACLCVALQPVPDLLVTGDGQHVGVRAQGSSEKDAMTVLRTRTGDYALQTLSESAAFEG